MLDFEQTQWWSQKFTPRYKAAGDWLESTQHTTDQGTYLPRGDKMCKTQHFKSTLIYGFLASNSISAKPCQFNVLLLWKWSQSVNLRNNDYAEQKNKAAVTVRDHSGAPQRVPDPRQMWWIVIFTRPTLFHTNFSLGLSNCKFNLIAVKCPKRVW